MQDRCESFVGFETLGGRLGRVGNRVEGSGVVAPGDLLFHSSCQGRQGGCQLDVGSSVPPENVGCDENGSFAVLSYAVPCFVVELIVGVTPYRRSELSKHCSNSYLTILVSFENSLPSSPRNNSTPKPFNSSSLPSPTIEKPSPKSRLKPAPCSIPTVTRTSKLLPISSLRRNNTPSAYESSSKE